jgi:hypothetical protein
MSNSEGYKKLFWSWLRPSHYILKDNLSLGEYGYVLLHLWRLPSFFDENVSWTIYYKHARHAHRRADEESIPYVREIRWNYHQSGLAIDTISDDAEIRDAPLDREQFLTLLSKGRQIQIPLVDVGFYTGQDGIMYGLEMPGQGFGSFRLTWWSKYPDDWAPIVEWYSELVAFIEKALK